MTWLVIPLLLAVALAVVLLLARDNGYDGIDRWHEDLQALRSATGTGSQVSTDDRAWEDAVSSHVRVVAEVPGPRPAYDDEKQPQVKSTR